MCVKYEGAHKCAHNDSHMANMSKGLIRRERREASHAVRAGRETRDHLKSSTFGNPLILARSQTPRCLRFSLSKHRIDRYNEVWRTAGPGPRKANIYRSDWRADESINSYYISTSSLAANILCTRHYNLDDI